MSEMPSIAFSRPVVSSVYPSPNLPDACGHADLAHTIRRFATTWDDRRQGMSDALGSLAGVLRDIHTAFEDLDRELGSSAGAR